MVNFLRLGLGPNFSSNVTVLFPGLEKPSVAVLLVFLGESHHGEMKTWKPFHSLRGVRKQPNAQQSAARQRRRTVSLWWTKTRHTYVLAAPITGPLLLLNSPQTPPELTSHRRMSWCFHSCLCKGSLQSCVCVTWPATKNTHNDEPKHYEHSQVKRITVISKEGYNVRIGW